MFTIYKSGQGYWTRVLTAIGAGTLVVTGVFWLWAQMQRLTSSSRVYYQSAMAVVIIFVFGALFYWLLNKPNIADFMIATEGEMKKVNWPSRRQVVSLTWVVICGTITFAVFLWLINMLFGLLFLEMGVLQGSED